MYNAGDLNPDKLGRVTRQHFRQALSNGIGMNEIAAASAAFGAARWGENDTNQTSPSMVASPFQTTYLNIFKFHENLGGINTDLTSGIRAVSAEDVLNDCKGKLPCPKRFNEVFQRFASFDRHKYPEGRMYLKDIEWMLQGYEGCKAKHPTNSSKDLNGDLKCMQQPGNKIVPCAGMSARHVFSFRSAFLMLLEAFGRTDGDKLYLSLPDLRDLFMYSRYPQGWQIRPFPGSRQTAAPLLFMSCPKQQDGSLTATKKP
eukprot:gnl/TRDRNA2_/TRDRNA2_84919_c0_seq1.p1 gnl/TRDRNA2_/TRDRNA2_84919_c0~~gnl/TRDRNA2_/TRDRNA2_84919_c0_seq1.p1  ORF type:complete len:258 (+),score=19.55 gnl/TRDRNA2_/TRDRNA2_84919_c0_seq1:115-888(+)